MQTNYETPWGRTELLVGQEGVQRLAQAKVFVFGLGGVGSYAAEALARAGVGRLVLVDFDTIERSNLNRQLFALHSTLGQRKVRVAEAHLRDIHPDIRIEAIEAFAEADTVERILGEERACVIDAIDSVHAKVSLLHAAYRRNWPAVSCMGAANKLNPVGIQVADIANTRCCALARVIRERLRRLGIHRGIRCVYSEENLGHVFEHGTSETRRKARVQGSISYVPGIIGLTAAGVIIQDILGPKAP